VPLCQTVSALPHVIGGHSEAQGWENQVDSTARKTQPKHRNVIGLKRASFGACPLGLVPMKHYLVTAR
jgi:hypothetical protein